MDIWQLNLRTDGHTNLKTYRWTTNGKAYRWTDRQTVGHADGQTDKQTDGDTDGHGK